MQQKQIQTPVRVRTVFLPVFDTLHDGVFTRLVKIFVKHLRERRKKERKKKEERRKKEKKESQTHQIRQFFPP